MPSKYIEKERKMAKGLSMSKTKFIAVNSVLCALVLLFVFVPISIGALQLAVIAILATIISAEFYGWKNGLFTGGFFGVVSLINHLARPGVLSFAFYNPLVSIVPRLLIGVVSYFVVKGLKKAFSKKYEETTNVGKNSIDIFCYAMGAAAGVITNTVGVLGMILAFYHGRAIGSSAIGFPWVAGVILTNSLLEIAICTVITPPIILALKKTIGK